MNRFVVFYCTALLMILVALFFPKHMQGGVVPIVLFVVFFAVVFLTVTTKLSQITHTHRIVMTFLLVLIWLKTIGEVSELTIKEYFDLSHKIVYAQLTGKHKDGSTKGSYNHYFDYHYNNDNKSIYVSSDDFYNESLFKEALILISPSNKIIKPQVSDFEKRKFKYPVEYRNNLEYGNDSYDYYFVEPYTALNNFGLRRVTEKIENSSRVLYYQNVNPSLDSVAHPVKEGFQTATNRAKVDTSFAFLFHDGIYSKEQVFEEIPEAKEYYYKYYKESE